MSEEFLFTAIKTIVSDESQLKLKGDKINALCLLSASYAFICFAVVNLCSALRNAALLTHRCADLRHFVSRTGLVNCSKLCIMQGEFTKCNVLYILLLNNIVFFVLFFVLLADNCI